MKSSVEIFLAVNPTFNEAENQERKFVFEYETELEGEAAAEEAYRMFNAPIEFLEGRQADICLDYRSKRNRSLSVGDVVTVGKIYNRREFLCCGSGWKEINTTVGSVLV